VSIFRARTFEINTLQPIVDRFPRFAPHPLLSGGHLQTVAAALFQGRRFPHRAKLHPVVLDDGDTTILHDDQPADWSPTSPVAILLHGLAGCGRSSYMTRTAGLLNEAGVRTFRMDFRACGVGENRSRLPYHGGCSGDLLQAMQRVVELCPSAPLNLIAYSIGGNVALKLLGESNRQLPANLDRAVIVSPPIDVGKCVNRLTAAPTRYYGRYLVKLLYKQLRRSPRLVDQAPQVIDAPRPLTQRVFDELYTAPVWGFESADALYNATSSLPFINDIRVSTLLLSSRDDPLVPVEMFEQLKPPAALSVHLTDSGGHLGFIGRGGTDPNRRWMDWRVVDAVTANRAVLRRSAAA
jgi:predicted alpha/beta-fold hydrolase